MDSQIDLNTQNADSTTSPGTVNADSTTAETPKRPRISVSRQRDIVWIRYKDLARKLIANNFVGFGRIYQEAYKSDNKASCDVKASRLLRKEKFQRALKEVQEEIPARELVSDDFVLKNIYALSTTAKREADRLKALELLGKWLSLWKDNEQKTSIGIFQGLDLCDTAKVDISNTIQGIDLQDKSTLT